MKPILFERKQTMPHKKLKIKITKLPIELKEVEDFDQLLQETLEDEIPIQKKLFKKMLIGSMDCTKLQFEDVRFERCKFSHTILNRTSFVNVEFIDCIFEHCEMSHTWFSQCKIEESSFKACQFVKADFSDVTITKSNFRYSNFTQSYLKKCLIQHSDMSETFFAESTLKLFYPIDSKFIKVEFFKTSLANIDFSTCDIQGICVSEDCSELKGIIVDIYQAAELSRLIGVCIKP